MWTFTHTETTAADADAIWRHYADVATWPNWDHGIERVTIDGPFAPGTTGALTPTGGPKFKFVMLDVIEGEAFTDETRLPGARLRFNHRLTPMPGGGTLFTHTVTITGPMTWLFRRVIGKGIEADMPTTMRTLADLAAR